MKKALSVKADRVYGRHDKEGALLAHRRVVGIISDRVVYSRGGDRLMDCSLKTFQRWATCDITKSGRD